MRDGCHWRKGGPTYRGFLVTKSELTNNFLPVVYILEAFSDNLRFLVNCNSNIHMSVRGRAEVFSSDHNYGRRPPKQNSQELVGMCLHLNQPPAYFPP